MSWYNMGEPRQDWASSWRHFWTLREKNQSFTLSAESLWAEGTDAGRWVTSSPAEFVIRKPAGVPDGDPRRRWGILNTEEENTHFSSVKTAERCQLFNQCRVWCDHEPWPWHQKCKNELFYPSQHMTVNKPSTNGLLCVSVSELTNVSASWVRERRTCWSRLKVSVSRTNCETESSAVDGYRSRLTSQPLKQKQNCITDHRTSHQTLSSWHHFLQTQKH